MTLVLELPAEVESRLQDEATARGIAVEVVAVERLGASYALVPTKDDRHAIRQRLRGSVKGAHPTVDEFLAERSAEGRKEAGL